MKKFLSIILCVCVILSVSPAFVILPAAGESATSGNCGDLTWDYQDNVLTVSGKGDMPDYYYDEVNNYDNIPWYSYRDDIEKVVIGDGVTRIGNLCFFNCQHLTEVFMGKDVQSIGNGSFGNCRLLPEISLVEGIKSIETGAFSECSALSVVHIPKTLEKFGYNCFNNDWKLSEVHISDIAAWCDIEFGAPDVSLNETFFMNSNPLRYAHNLYLNNQLVTELVIPEGVTEIKPRAFMDCKNITEITIPSSLSCCGVDAFRSVEPKKVFISDLSNWCKITFESILSNPLNSAELIIDGETVTDVNFPDGLDEVKPFVFSGYDNLKTVTLPDSITKIGERAFSYSGLKEISFSENIETIENEAFRNCNQLTNVCLPSKLNAVNDYTFEDCDALKSVTFGNSVTKIGAQAFYSCSSLTDILLPDSLCRIEANAFYNCTALEKINIPEKLTAVGPDAFYNCQSLKRVDISDISSLCKIKFVSKNSNPLTYAHNLYKDGELVTEAEIEENTEIIEDYAFCNCVNLTKVSIPKSVTQIGEDAFFGCSGLNRIDIEDADSWSKISFKNEFSNPLYYGHNLYLCGSPLKNLVLPNDLTQVNSFAFYKDENLESVTIPNGVTEIGQYAFKDCSSLKEIVLPQGLQSIGAYSFCNCPLIKTVTIPDSVNTIDICCFENCTGLEGVYISDLQAWCNISFNLNSNPLHYANKLYLNGESLTKIEIPQGVKNIKKYCFDGLSSLTEITIPDGVTAIESYAFEGCSGLKNAIIPNSVTSMGNSAFSGCSSLESISLPFAGNRRTAYDNDYQYTFGYIFGKSSYENSYAAKQEYVYWYFVDKQYEDWWFVDEATYYIPESLKTVNITDGNYIPNYAFERCKHISNIYLPLSMKIIGEDAFNGCTDLNIVNYGGNEVDRKSISIKTGNTKLTGAHWYYNGVPHIHNFIKQKVVEKTCVDDGYTLYSCDCGYSYKGDISSATGHNFDEWIPAKCTCQGGTVGHYECSVCKGFFDSDKQPIKNPYIKSSGNHSFEMCHNSKKHYKKCTLCGEITEEENHDYNVFSGSPATANKNGYLIYECPFCGYSFKKTVYPAKTFKLSCSTYTYNGKAKLPKVTVLDSHGNPVSNTDYTLTYSNNTKIGTALVRVCLIGNQAGSKTLKYKIIPQKPTVTLKTAKNKVTVSYKKVSGSVKYQIQYSAKKTSGFKNVKTNTTSLKVTKTKLKSKKTYYFRVRAYKKVGKTTYCSGWVTKAVKVK